MIKLPAAPGVKYRGTVLTNPGGPGGSGTFFVRFAGLALQTMTGSGYDVLGFDPRGVGASTPNAQCFMSDSERFMFAVQGRDRLLNASDDSVGIYRAREQVIGARCEDFIGGEDGITRYMGTASVARDMVEIAQGLGESEVNYWGFVSSQSAFPCHHLWR